MNNLESNILKLLKCSLHNPFALLGAHPQGEDETLIRVFLPKTSEAWVNIKDKSIPMEKQGPYGFFEAVVQRDSDLQYMIAAQDEFGHKWSFHDPYTFGPQLSDFDLHLIGEGTHYEKYRRLGAHLHSVDAVEGVLFALWAPNAKAASVTGDFNHWDGRSHLMRSRGASGVWELFVPGLAQGDVYKYQIHTSEGTVDKADPFGFYAELRPQTASLVWDIDSYEWADSEWMDSRKERNWLSEAVAIYEVHLGSWLRGEDDTFLNYRELAHKLVDYVKELGFTHIEVLPIQEHPLDASWGYQVLGYFSVSSRFGTPEDFKYFVDYCHQNDVGVIMDWVPAHFPKDGHGLAFFDGTHLYEHDHPFMRDHQDWGTNIFNYGRKEVANFLLNSALFWLAEYHIDGLRVDAVASMLYLDYSREDGQWIPNKFGGNESLEAIEFLKKFNELCHEKFPGVLTIAEESTAWPMVSRPTYMGGLGFSLKWNMGWMHDVLEYFSMDPIHRKYHHHNLSFGLVYAFQENFVLVLSHDEVVHGKRSLLDKMPGDMWQKFANLRLLLGYMSAHPGKTMLFMGGEIGQWNEWNFEASLSWDLLEHEQHSKLKTFMGDINKLVASEPALHELDFQPEGFEWINFNDSDNCVVSFIRKGKDKDDFLVMVFNFTPVPRVGYRVGVPRLGAYKEILNSDSDAYWGSNVGNSGRLEAQELTWNGRPYSLNLTAPPLGMLILKPE
jgi:1,4-alpha-glucan branching enzyme